MNLRAITVSLHTTPTIKRGISFMGLCLCLASCTLAQKPLKIAIAGLTHDHVNGLLQQYREHEVVLAGIAEPNEKLVAKYRERFHLPDSLFFKDLPSMLKARMPDVVMAFNDIAGHLSVVQAAAPLGIHVMVEKPLAITVRQANAMSSLASRYHIQLLTNYETTWYPSNQLLYRKIKDNSPIGEIRKMVVHDGHKGPKEINVSAEFLEWLTDPAKNGAGALTDFGCYGANLMTWLMDGETPIAVTAVTRHLKPDVYPKVDDDATIILEYRKATGIIQASWNWPFNVKDLEVFGATGYMHAVNSSELKIRERENEPLTSLDVKSPGKTTGGSYLEYLSAVVKKQILPGEDLSSLSNNIIVVRILEAARLSAKKRKKDRSKIKLSKWKQRISSLSVAVQPG